METPRYTPKSEGYGREVPTEEDVAGLPQIDAQRASRSAQRRETDAFPPDLRVIWKIDLARGG